MKTAIAVMVAAFLIAPAALGQAPQYGDMDVKEAPEAPPEPDYATVAADARKIADQIEERLIENDMADAKGYLAATDPANAYPKAEEAYRDMEEMIQFCEATASGAGAACQFKLGIKMSLNPGNTLGQMRGAMGSNMGDFGAGQGGGGGSSAQRFGMYGPTPFGQPASRSTRIGDRKTEGNAAKEPGTDPLAGNVEEVQNEKRDAFDVTAESDAPILEEYRPLIEAYFKRLAEEDR